ncbi:hypothetical protein KP509_03G004400 [Ceratopteris richardii]|uniref:Uncharacterized protein n=1 Tax=Ceratopteris richardii TaxID=49495 RepID=A0A8T2V4L9_CERRI|nr:hypothetical protein KP509_03G004400 [Ceratopteris richardii]
MITSKTPPINDTSVMSNQVKKTHIITHLYHVGIVKGTTLLMNPCANKMRHGWYSWTYQYPPIVCRDRQGNHFTHECMCQQNETQVNATNIQEENEVCKRKLTTTKLREIRFKRIRIAPQGIMSIDAHCASMIILMVLQTYLKITITNLVAMMLDTSTDPQFHGPCAKALRII